MAEPEQDLSNQVNKAMPIIVLFLKRQGQHKAKDIMIGLNRRLKLCRRSEIMSTNYFHNSSNINNLEKKMKNGKLFFIMC